MSWTDDNYNLEQRPDRRFIGDDWIFFFSAYDSQAVPPGPANLAGWTPGGILNILGGTTLAVTGSMVDTSTLAVGTFSLTIPRATTASYLPDETAYRLQVFLIDPANNQHTYLVIPLIVLAP